MSRDDQLRQDIPCPSVWHLGEGCEDQRAIRKIRLRHSHYKKGERELTALMSIEYRQ